MYENTAAQFRPELQVKVEQGMAVDKKFIAEKLFPVFPVKTRKGVYKKVKRGKGQLMANPGKNTADDPLKRAPGTAYRQITRSFDQGGWGCEDRGLEESMDDVDKQEQSRFFDLESSTARWLMRQMRIARESRVAGYAYDEEVWGDAVESDTAFIEANIATFDFPRLLISAMSQIEKRGEEANTLVLSKALWDLIARSEKMRSYFLGNNAGLASISLAMVAEKFELAQILVGKGSFDTTKPGKDATDANLVWTWGDEYFGVYNVQGGAPENGGAGRTFLLEDTTGGQLFVTESYRHEETRSDRLRVRQDEGLNTCNENCGVLTKVN